MTLASASAKAASSAASPTKPSTSIVQRPAIASVASGSAATLRSATSSATRLVRATPSNRRNAPWLVSWSSACANHGAPADVSECAPRRAPCRLRWSGLSAESIGVRARAITRAIDRSAERTLKPVHFVTIGTSLQPHLSDCFLVKFQLTIASCPGWAHKEYSNARVNHCAYPRRHHSPLVKRFRRPASRRFVSSKQRDASGGGPFFIWIVPADKRTPSPPNIAGN